MNPAEPADDVFDWQEAWKEETKVPALETEVHGWAPGSGARH